MNERIRLIDALRGLSLAGIAMAHFGEWWPAGVSSTRGTMR
jgi:peptidoglycan/LPS O-acetylase OafA/YrhL